MNDEASLGELKALVSGILNPTSPEGEKATQLVELYAIPIGERARSFYETIGIPSDHIFDVPDTLGVPFLEAMARASSPFVPKEFEQNGDALLRLMREERKRRPSEIVHWWPKKNP